MLRTRYGLLALAFALPLAACDTGGSSDNDDEPTEFTRVTVTEVELNDYPTTEPDGDDWDLGSGPDISFQMRDEFDDPTTLEGGDQADIDPTELPLRWTLTDSQNPIPEVELTRASFDEEYYLCAIENDVSGDTDMGCTDSFVIDSLVADDYPTTFTVTGTEDVEFRLRLRWEE